MEREASLERVYEVVRAAEDLGHEVRQDGTRLVGRAPHVGSEAWLHIIYRPLNGLETKALERSLGRELPDEFKWFLRRMNGINLFSDSFAIDGLRTGYSRADPEDEQPYDITTPNQDERPPDAHESLLFVGGYEWDGSLVYIDPRTSRAHRCTRESAEPLDEWPSFLEMLASEAVRLSRLFDARGRKIDPDAPTTPS
jgi:hypothetical protein